MDPPPLRASRTPTGLPHPRGDGPDAVDALVLLAQSPPPAWGWTRSTSSYRPQRSVSPTRVGMDPSRSPTGPRTSWRVTRSTSRSRPARASPPPAWGWTQSSAPAVPARCVSPTRVGMDRPAKALQSRGERLPHPRGDGPRVPRHPIKATASPPPAWGWTHDGRRAHPQPQVSPTRVGMDPRPGRPSRRPCRLPHPRGDGPGPVGRPARLIPSPPPAWGWTPF